MLAALGVLVLLLDLLHARLHLLHRFRRLQLTQGEGDGDEAQDDGEDDNRQAELAIQMLVFIALYRALAFVVGGSPESLVGLSQRIYPWSYLSDAIPLGQSFLWLKLGEVDNTFILPLMVGVSTYVQTKLAQTPSSTPQQQQQQQMMTWMMPLVMVWITLSLPSGVGVYWVISNIFSVFASYIVYGRRMSWRNLLPTPAATPNKKLSPKMQPDVQEEAETTASSNPQEARSAHGKRRGKRKKRRRGY